MSRGNTSFHVLNVKTHEHVTHPITDLFGGGLSLTAIDFVSGVALCKERHGDMYSHIATIDAVTGASLHSHDDVLCTKRVGSVYGIHQDPSRRLWLASGRGKSTRFLIFDEKMKPAKFERR